MDRGRYVFPPSSWDPNSALLNVHAARDVQLRFSAASAGREFPEEKFAQHSGFPRETFHSELAPPGVEEWPPPASNRSCEDGMEIIHSHDSHDITGSRDINAYRDIGYYRDSAGFRDKRSYEDVDAYHGKRQARERDGYYDRYVPRKDYASDEYECEYEFNENCTPPKHSHSREDSYDGKHEHSKYSDHDAEHEERRYDRSLCRHGHREWHREQRGKSRECDKTSERGGSRKWDSAIGRCRERSRSYSSDEYDHRSYSPRRWASSYTEDFPERRRDRDVRRHYGRVIVTPTATLVVKGLSPKMVEDDLYRALGEWGPLQHVRVIKERTSGVSRGFAFIDFPSVDAAKAMMDAVGDEGLILDGRHLFFEYSKPAGSGSQATLLPVGSTMDWICTMCGCVNFARRMSCFQCNEMRTEDAPSADTPISASNSLVRKGLDSGPTHVLVVRGLDDHVNEEMLYYEFSKHAPLKDLRLVRDKFTRVSRGFAFVHFHSVEDATKALDATNGIAFEKTGQLLRVAYAKNIHGSGSASGNPSCLAAAAIEAAAFSQQYGTGVRTMKDSSEKADGGISNKNANIAPQSGFVWDEASGYYYDAASGFYYDGHRGLYYDGNYGVWYTYNVETQQYVPYELGTVVENATDMRNSGVSSNETAVDASNEPKSISENEKQPSLAEAVEAAAIAAQAAAKKDKEKMKAKEKEIRLTSKSALLAHKKRLNNAVSLWKQRQQEGECDTAANARSVEKQESTTGGSLGLMLSHTNVIKASVVAPMEGRSRPLAVSDAGGHRLFPEITAGIRSSTSASSIGFVDTQETRKGAQKYESLATRSTSHQTSESKSGGAPFKTDASALALYATPPSVGTKRRFTEAPQSVYRDRAAERRSLYGSSSFHEDASNELNIREKGSGLKSRELDMPFPPGVGAKGSVPVAGSAVAGPEVQPFEVITMDKAIDEKNVGNRMLRNMGWQEGLGLGKDGNGIVEPVQALVTEDRAGLGSLTDKKVDPRFETQPGDSYRVALQKRALQRFHDM